MRKHSKNFKLQKKKKKIHKINVDFRKIHMYLQCICSLERIDMIDYSKKKKYMKMKMH